MKSTGTISTVFFSLIAIVSGHFSQRQPQSSRQYRRLPAPFDNPEYDTIIVSKNNVLIMVM